MDGIGKTFEREAIENTEFTKSEIENTIISREAIPEFIHEEIITEFMEVV